MAQIVAGYLPGALGRSVELHGAYYAREWGFPAFFECKVAREMAAFLSDFDPARDGFWSVVRRGRVEGTIALDGVDAPERGAHLRWFILSDALRGQGLGDRLLAEAVGFARARKYPSIRLWTFRGLDSARHLYEKHGFVLVEETEGRQWGAKVWEQKFVATL